MASEETRDLGGAGSTEPSLRGGGGAGREHLGLHPQSTGEPLTV